MEGYIEVKDTENKDCDICDLSGSKDCQYPYCERNKVVFKKKR